MFAAVLIPAKLQSFLKKLQQRRAKYTLSFGFIASKSQNFTNYLISLAIKASFTRYYFDISI